MSLDELEKAAEATENPVELQKDMVRRQWKVYIIRNTLWHVRDAWREGTPNCIRGAWKKLCPGLAVDFGGFDSSEGLLRECLKCLKLARKVGLDEVEEDDVDSLLESIGEELSPEDLEDLEKQRRQLEEEVEAGRHPTTLPRKEQTIEVLQDFFGSVHTMLDKMETMDPDFERSGLKSRQILDAVTFCRRGGGQLCRAPLIASLRRNPPPLTPLLVVKSLSKGPPQAAIPALLFRRRLHHCRRLHHRQM